jgi:hypothetical protein
VPWCPDMMKIDGGSDASQVFRLVVGAMPCGLRCPEVLFQHAVRETSASRIRGNLTGFMSFLEGKGAGSKSELYKRTGIERASELVERKRASTLKPVHVDHISRHDRTRIGPLDAHFCSAPPPAERHGGTNLLKHVQLGLGWRLRRRRTRSPVYCLQPRHRLRGLRPSVVIAQPLSPELAPLGDM